MRKKFIALISIPLLLILSAGAFAGDITATGISQGDLFKLLSNLTTAANNHILTKPGLAVGTDAIKVKTTYAVSYAAGGYLYTKAAKDGITGTGAVQAASTYCLYLVSVDSSGDFIITKGNAISTNTAVLPTLPGNTAPVGYFKVATPAAVTYTLGTDATTKGGLVVTYFDIATMISGPSKVSLTGL